MGHDERDRQLPGPAVDVALHLLVPGQAVLHLRERRRPGLGADDGAHARPDVPAVDPGTAQHPALDPRPPADLARPLPAPAEPDRAGVPPLATATVARGGPAVCALRVRESGAPAPTTPGCSPGGRNTTAMLRRLALVSTSALLLGPRWAAASADAGPAAHGALVACSSGAHTLSHLGDHVYPDMGNGGYTSLHTDVHMVYDAPSNQFLPGNHVVLTDRATQCLTDFSLDLERFVRRRDRRSRPDRAGGHGQRRARVVPSSSSRPTPATRTGQDDPDPLAHQASQVTPGRRARPQPAPAGVLAAGHRRRRQRAERRRLSGEQARDHAAATAARRAAVFQVVGRLHRPAGGPPRRRRLDRGLVPLRRAGRRRRVRDHRAGRHRGLDAAEQPPERQADVRLLRHRQRRAARRSPTAGCCRTVRTAPDAAFPSGSTTFHWRSGGARRQLPGREQRRPTTTSPRGVGSDGIRYYEAQASSLEPGAEARQPAR